MTQKIRKTRESAMTLLHAFAIRGIQKKRFSTGQFFKNGDLENSVSHTGCNCNPKKKHERKQKQIAKCALECRVRDHDPANPRNVYSKSLSRHFRTFRISNNSVSVNRRLPDSKWEKTD